MVRGSSKILASSTTFLTTFEEVMRSHLTVPLSPRHAGRSKAGFAISPHPSCTIIQKTGWTVKIKMGLIQIKFNLSLSIGYTPIITECVENVNGDCCVEHHIDSIRIDWIELVWRESCWNDPAGSCTACCWPVVPVFFICSASIITIHMNLSKT